MSFTIPADAKSNNEHVISRGTGDTPRSFGLCRESDDVPVTEVVDRFGAESGRALDHWIARVNKFLRGDEPGAMVAADLLNIPFLQLRMRGNTEKILVNLYTTTQGELQEEEFVQMLLNLPLEGKITGILHTHYDGLSDKTAADEEKVLYDRQEFQDRLLGLTFNVFSYSFFQTNSKAASNISSQRRFTKKTCV